MLTTLVAHAALVSGMLLLQRAWQLMLLRSSGTPALLLLLTAALQVGLSLAMRQLLRPSQRSTVCRLQGPRLLV